jgi:MFS family permease
MSIGQGNSLEIAKRRNSAILITSIYSVQLSTSAVIYNLNIIDSAFLMWIVIYYAFTLVAAIPQAGFSDFFGRKKHLIISSLSVLLSVAYLAFVYITKLYCVELPGFSLSIITTLPICLLLGVAGNAIPIARAGIADLKVHDFRTALGLSTTFIGFGWISAILLGIILPPIGVLITAMIVQFSVIVIIKHLFSDHEDSNIKSMKKTSYFHATINSYKWFASMFLVAGGAAAIVAYLFTETIFYQIYSLNEEGLVSLSVKVVGLLMAFGYAFGVVMQWIVGFSDKRGIRFGVLFSLVSLVFLVFLRVYADGNVNINVYNALIAEGVLNFLFAFGFGFSVPSLFTLMASKIEPHHAGRLFGAIDTTDTLALSLSAFALYLKDMLIINEINIYIYLLLFFMVSFIFYGIFIKRFSSYEKDS